VPYSIRKSEDEPDPWEVVKRDTGEIVSHHATEAKARKAVQSLYRAEGKPSHRWFR
jgi:hypothetical protein